MGCSWERRGSVVRRSWAWLGIVPLFAALAGCGTSGDGGDETEEEERGPLEARIPNESLEELNVPTSEDGPFSDEVFRKGLVAWRTPHSEGACASCHTADAVDLARFNYTDAVILRRAMGQEATVEQAYAIVDLVHYQRERLGFEKPLDPTKVRFLQPGGEVVEGETMTERDRNMYLELRTRGLRLFQPEPITTVEEAIEARNELLALDLRTVKVGIEFNQWTSDEFRGTEHRKLTKWIPELPSHPKAENVSDWYGLHNAYILDPSDENLWAIVDAHGEMTDNLGLAYSDTRSANMFRLKHRNVQLAGHMIQHDDTKSPAIHLVEDPYEFVLEGARTIGSSAPRHAVHARVNNLWEVGATMRGAHKSEEQDLMPDIVTRKTNDWEGDAQVNHLSWFWQGMIYDPALQFSAAGNKAEYFFAAMHDLRRRGESVEDGALTEMHHMFMSAVMWVHEKFGYDTRYNHFLNGDLSTPGHVGCRGGLHQSVEMPHHADAEAVPSDYLDLERQFASNLIRMVLFNQLEFWRRTGLLQHVKEDDYSRNQWLECLESSAESLKAFEPASQFASAQAAYEEARQLVENAEELDKGLYGASEDPQAAAKDLLFLTPMKYQSLPLQYPAAAEEPLPESPISPAFGQLCAGCHGEDGLGHGPGGESTDAFYPTLTGLSFERFEATVRKGRPARSGVHMPDFDSKRLTDEELRVIYDTLNPG